MDPLSIAASASGIATLCGTIIFHVSKFVIDSLAVRQSIDDFHKNIRVLKDVLDNVDQTAKKCPRSLPSAQKEELEHWGNIHNVLEACRNSMERLKNELPKPFQSGKTPSMIYSQLKICLKSSVIMQIRGDITLYTQTLQLSLTTMNLASTWDSQRSQNDVISEIQNLKRAIEVKRKGRQREQQKLVHQGLSLNSDDGQTLQEIEAEVGADKYIEAWIKSAEHLVASLYEPDEESTANRQEFISRGNPDDPVNENNSTEVAEGSLSPVEEGHGLSANGYRDRDVGGSDNGSDLVPRRESTNCLNPEVVLYQIEELQKDVTEYLHGGFYSHAERHQVKVIEKRDLLEKRHNIPFLDRSDVEETLADIYMQKKTPVSALIQARNMLEQLLKRERDICLESNDNVRKSRLCHKLALVHIELKLFNAAEEYATEAMNDRHKFGSTPTLIAESAYLLAEVCDLKGDPSEARGLKKWVEKNYPQLVDTIGSISTVSTNDTVPNPVTAASALQWCKEKGFDVDSQDFRFHILNADGKTPLHVAVFDNNWKILEHMVGRVETLETMDSDGCTALLLACGKRNRRTAKVLLDHRAQTDVRDKYHNTPLHRVQNADGGIEVAKLLFSHGVDINAKNGFNKTALHLACELGNEAMVDILLKNNADIDCHVPNGSTPLHVSIYNRRRSIVKILLDNDADTSIRDAKNRDAMKAAKETARGGPEIQKMLQKYMAKKRKQS